MDNSAPDLLPPRLLPCEGVRGAHPRIQMRGSQDDPRPCTGPGLRLSGGVGGVTWGLERNCAVGN